MLMIISLANPSMLSQPYGVGVLGKDGTVQPGWVFFSVQSSQNIKVIPAAQLKQADTLYNKQNLYNSVCIRQN